MADRLTRLRDEQGDAAEGAGSLDGEGTSFKRGFDDEELERLRQDREQRKVYGKQIFRLVCAWLTVVVVLLFAQGILGPLGCFDLSDSVLIAAATTTTASVTAMLVVVARYLFPRG